MYRSFLSKDQIPPKDQAVRIWAYGRVVMRHEAVVGPSDDDSNSDDSTTDGSDDANNSGGKQPAVASPVAFSRVRGEFEMNLEQRRKDDSTRTLKFLSVDPLKFWTAEFWEERQHKEPDRSFWDFIPVRYNPLAWYYRLRNRFIKRDNIREVSKKAGTGVQLAEVLLLKKQSRLRLITALASGAALIAPMLIMVLHATVLTRILTTCIFTAAAALVLAFFMKDSSPNDIAGATAAYAAVLIVFIGAGFSTVN
jgi:hypothetical protein